MRATLTAQLKSLANRLWNLLDRYVLATSRPGPRLVRGLAIGIVLAGLVIVLLDMNWFSSARRRARDNLYNPAPTSDIVTIVAIDDQTLVELGRSPATWERSVHAQLIDRLVEAETRVITFDILFDIPTPEDDTLAAAMQNARRNGTQIVLPVAGHRLLDDETATFDFFYTPVEDLRQQASALGHVNTLIDPDGVIRRMVLAAEAQESDESFFSLGLASYLSYQLLFPELVRVEPDRLSFPVRPGTDDTPLWTIRAREDGTAYISFFGEPSQVNDPQATFLAYSYLDVLNGDVPAEALEGKIVLIGVLDAIALPDRFPTPIAADNSMFGVEIHANFIETIHQLNRSSGATLRRPQITEQSASSQLMVAAGIVLLAGLLFTFMRWHTALLVTTLAALAYVAVAVYLFETRGLLLEMLVPLGGLGLAFMGSTVGNYVFEVRRRRQINDLFSRYVSPEIARKVVESFDRGALDLGGEEREMTVLFADVRGFTALAEDHSPHEVVEMLNYFLEQMNLIVMKHQGAINKYIGDNLMAFWNAPYSQDKHALLAVHAAVEMLRTIDVLNASQRFPTDLQFGIGVNTGPAVVGNIGSQQRLEYTPIGDTVNIASRLSGVARGGTCVIGPQTYAAVQDVVTSIKREEILLRGKAQPIIVYTLNRDALAVPTPTPQTGQAET